MTQKEILRIRLRLELSRAQFAELLGVDRKTVWRWETGEVEIPNSRVVAIRMLEKTMREDRPAIVS
jgi:DNA-binding transcriptional regulator YiaG